MIKALKRLPYLLLFFMVIISALSPVFAQTKEASKYFTKKTLKDEVKEQEQAVKAGEEGDPNVKAAVDVMTKSTAITILNSLVQPPKDLAEGGVKDAGLDTSAAGSLIGLMSNMYQSPSANTATYLADVFNSAGIAVSSPAYAQGVGFSALNPVLNAWKIFRNIAYFFFVIIFVVIGFMIMFRQKISSQTVVTAQQAIPSIIIALLMVTFSYAISGLLIDLMYLIMFFLLAIFRQTEVLVDQNILGLGGLLLTGEFFDSAYNSVGTFVTRGLGGDTSGSTVGLPELAGVLSGIAAAIIIAIALVIGLFRLFFELLKSYISILLSIAMAPVILMLGAIPGRNTFGPWIKSLVGNLAAFPTVVLILIIYNQLTGNIVAADATASVTPQAYAQTAPDARTVSEGAFLPPYLIGTGDASTITFLIGFGMILIMTDLVVQAKKAISGGSGGVFEQLGQALGDSLKRGYTGGELIPGVGFTDTRKWPLGGLSGENVMRKGAIGGAAGAMGALGAGRGMWREGLNRGAAVAGFGEGAKRGASFAGRRLGDPTLKKWIEKRDKEAEEAKKSGGQGRKPPL